MMYMKMILNAAFLRIWDMGVTAGYCILAVLALRFLLRRFPRRYLYLFWLVVAFRLVCPVSVSTGFSLFNLELFGAGRPLAAEYAEDALEVSRRSAESGAKDMAGQEAGEKPAEELPAPVHPPVDRPQSLNTSLREFLYQIRDGKQTEKYLQAGTCVWIAGMLVFWVYGGISAGKLRRKVRRAVRVKPDGAGRDQIYECDGLPSPFVMGIVHPRIYLPYGLQGEQRSLVLLHEQYHIRRKDHLVKYLSCVLLSVYWFHPLVWAAWICMCRDMEMSCDEKVLELLGGEKRREYSRTLLAFAVEGSGGSRMPLAFGEQDVGKRIRHILDFRKPTIGAGIAAAAVILAALLLLGTNGTGGGEEVRTPLREEEETGQNMAERLYEARNPYVGDASANGRLLGVITEAFPDVLAAKTSFKTELQTSGEPYAFHFRLEKEPPERELEQELEELDMTVTAVLMLALTDNLGVVQWSYGSPDKEVLQEGGSLDAAGAAAWCGADDIKEFAASAEDVQDLLDRVRSLYIRPHDSTLPFMAWYLDLPSELYEQAVPIGAEAYEERSAGEPQMFLLAQTEDGSVFVYGCSSRKYGDRGIMIDHRVPAGESHVSFMDERYWGGKWPETGTEVSWEDADQDGSEEVVLRRRSASGAERLTVFEVDEDGDLETAEIREENKIQ